MFRAIQWNDQNVILIHETIPLKHDIIPKYISKQCLKYTVQYTAVANSEGNHDTIIAFNF
jgi:hypothetical protein